MLCSGNVGKDDCENDDQTVCVDTLEVGHALLASGKIPPFWCRRSVIFHDSILIYNSKFVKLTLSDCHVSMLHLLLPCFVLTFTKLRFPQSPKAPGHFDELFLSILTLAPWTMDDDQ